MLLDIIRKRFQRPATPPGPVQELKDWQRAMERIWSRIERLESRYGKAEAIDSLWREFEDMESKEAELLWAVRKMRKLI